MQLRNLRLDPLEDVCDVLGIGDLLLDGSKDDLLGERSSDEGFVVAGSFGGREAPGIAAALAADLSDRGAGRTADHAAGE